MRLKIKQFLNTEIQVFEVNQNPTPRIDGIFAGYLRDARIDENAVLALDIALRQTTAHPRPEGACISRELIFKLLSATRYLPHFFSLVL